MEAYLNYLPEMHHIVLIVILLLVIFQEAINGFHDTATAIATVIYSKSMTPRAAVMMSAFLNFAGVILGGTGVAFAMVSLLPTSMVAGIANIAESSFMLSLVFTAVVWNFTTWYFGIPSSTTHSYVGAFLGVGVAYALLNSGDLASLNWHEGQKVLITLLVSPVVGFFGAMLMYWLMKTFFSKNKGMFEHSGDNTPPLFVRSALIGSAAGVSFLHGTNDGQKSIGLMMLVVIALMPTLYSVNPDITKSEFADVKHTIINTEKILISIGDDPGMDKFAKSLEEYAYHARQTLGQYTSIDQISKEDLNNVRTDLLYLQEGISKVLKKGDNIKALSDEEKQMLKDDYNAISHFVDYVPWWVIFISALALGVGTAVGYKRIVLTLGERMGHTKLNAAQGTAAQMTAVACIGMADGFHLPVSTTHVLSAGIAGSYKAAGKQMNMVTLRNILITWVTTIPVTMILSIAMSFLFYYAFV